MTSARSGSFYGVADLVTLFVSLLMTAGEDRCVFCASGVTLSSQVRGVALHQSNAAVADMRMSLLPWGEAFAQEDLVGRVTPKAPSVEFVAGLTGYRASRLRHPPSYSGS